MLKNRIILLDTETFGLDVKKDLILEVGFRIMNLDLTETLASMSLAIWDSSHDDRYGELRRAVREGNKDAEFVAKMHKANGLFMHAAEKGVSLTEASRTITRWLDTHKVLLTEPLCGSSVGYDRAVLAEYLPEINKRFSHRIVDVSSLKELCQATNPTMFSHMQEDIEMELDSSKALHRVDTCLDATVAELRWYMDNFLFIPGGRFDS